MTDPNRVFIFDTTLRDGEQSPGATMTLEEKLRIARKLEELGVDILEAGFPAASPGEVESVRRIASVIERAQVAGLCRTRESDIRTSWEALKDAAHPRLHIFIATSKLHMEHKLKMDPQQVLDEVRRAVSLGRELCDTIEFSAEDATRSELGFLGEVFDLAIECGASVLNVPDTVGYTMPSEYTKIISEVKKVVGSRPVTISAHCHNDLGLAVANSLAAIAAGARQVECCVNGIGERAGNAALEELAMALRVRNDLVGCHTGINTKEIASISQLVSDITGLLVGANKPVVGKNAFSHEAGIHQHGMMADRRTYEIMTPEEVGRTESRMVLGKHSGRHALQERLTVLGYQLGKRELDGVFDRFKALADRKKNIYDEDLTALVADAVYDMPTRFTLKHVEFRGGDGQKPWAKVTIAFDGADHTAEGSGNGPVNASFDAVKKCTGNEDVVLDDYQLKALTLGSDAQARASLAVSGGQSRSQAIQSRGQATDSDIVKASVLAFIKALNHKAHQEEISKRSADRA